MSALGGYWVGEVKGSLNTSGALSVPGSPVGSTDGSVNILLIGLDSRRDMNGGDLPRDLLDTMHVGSSSAVGGYNTNVLILLHIPPGGRPATAFSIPRDDYVEVPGRGMYKIKEAYGRAKADAVAALEPTGVSGAELERRSRDAGRVATVRTVWNLLGVPIDHFAEVNLVGFYDLASALGGIPVCLKHAVSDPDYSGIDLPAGAQTLNGGQALAFVRQRHDLAGGDLDRTRRQQAFLTGTVDKLRGDGVFSDLGRMRALLDVAKKDVVVDARFDPISFLGQASALTRGGTAFNTLPVEGFAMRAGQAVNLVDAVKLRSIVQAAFHQGSPLPAAPATPTVSASPSASGTLDSAAAAFVIDAPPTPDPGADPARPPAQGPAPSQPAEVAGIPCVD